VPRTVPINPPRTSRTIQASGHCRVDLVWGAQAERQGRFGSRARVVVDVPEHEGQTDVERCQCVDPSVDQGPANATTLRLGHYGKRRQDARPATLAPSATTVALVKRMCPIGFPSASASRLTTG